MGPGRTIKAAHSPRHAGDATIAAWRIESALGDRIATPCSLCNCLRPPPLPGQFGGGDEGGGELFVEDREVFHPVPVAGERLPGISGPPPGPDPGAPGATARASSTDRKDRPASRPHSTTAAWGEGDTHRKAGNSNFPALRGLRARVASGFLSVEVASPGNGLDGGIHPGSLSF